MSASVKSWMFVIVQMILIVSVFLAPTSPGWDVPSAGVWIGRSLQVLGLTVMGLAALRLGGGLTALPVPNAAAKLRNDGVYSVVRHPMYTGLLALCAGEVVVSGSLFSLILWLGLLWWLTLKTRWEELHLAARFPDYPEYVASHGRFVPRWRTRQRDRSP